MAKVRRRRKKICLFYNFVSLDLSFETQDFLSFGMIVLRGGRVVLHEQRNEQRKDEVKE
jgi:hypothetical protein